MHYNEKEMWKKHYKQILNSFFKKERVNIRL